MRFSGAGDLARRGDDPNSFRGSGERARFGGGGDRATDTRFGGGGDLATDTRLGAGEW